MFIKKIGAKSNMKNKLITEMKEFLKREFTFTRDDIKIIEWTIVIGYSILFLAIAYVYLFYS